MKQELNAYVPEIDFTDHKSLLPLRTHREELSVVEPADQYRILAHRPYLNDKEITLPSLWSISDDELSFLQTALTSHRRVALFADGKAVLFLSELYAASGLLLAVRPQCPPAALRRYADTCGWGAIAFSPSFPMPAASLSEDEFEEMAELNYYLGQILTPRKEVGIATLAWRIANFVGCRLSESNLPTEETLLPEAQRNRLVAYLFCVFLHLHTLSGSVSAADASDEKAPHFRFRIEYVDPGADETNDTLLQLASLRFYKLPAFSDFVLRRQGERLILDAGLPLSSKHKSFRSAIPSLFILRITLEKAEAPQ